MYFPRPSDIVPTGGTKSGNNPELHSVTCLAPLKSMPSDAKTNLPAAWLLPVYSCTTPSKSILPQWVTIDWFKEYLCAEIQTVPPLKNNDKKLYQTEHRIGIGIDPATRSARKEQFYAAEHLRLCNGTRLWVQAQLNNNDPKHASDTVSLEKLSATTITLGGESRMCQVSPGVSSNIKELIPKPDGKLLKWVLVTPTVFNTGWCPNWINPVDGAVLLKAGEIERRPGEARRAWRERVRKLDNINAYLKAVYLPKPIFFSGWDVNLENNGQYGGPKPTVMAVASGSVYYFEAVDDAAAGALVSALHGRTMSDCFGEKGLGLGFCGRWHYSNLLGNVQD